MTGDKRNVGGIYHELEPTEAALDIDVSPEAVALLSAASVRAYRADLKDFKAWCAQHGKESLPASAVTVAEYITERAKTHRISTLSRRLAAITWLHDDAGYNSPSTTAIVRRTLKRLRREHRSRKSQKAPLTLPILRELLPLTSIDMRGQRDKAILLMGWAGAFRRSELAGVRYEDCTVDAEGIVVLLSRSKTDQEGEGREVPVPYGEDPDCCPVRAVLDWVAIAGITKGPLFRAIDQHGHISPKSITPEAIALIVKKYITARAIAQGVAPEAAEVSADRFGGHSLRAGLVTSAAAAGADDKSIMRTTGHKSRTMVDTYVRSANLWSDNAAKRAGL